MLLTGIPITHRASRSRPTPKDGLVRLGPTFVKLGQVVSTRTDIFSDEYIQVRCHAMSVIEEVMPARI